MSTAAAVPIILVVGPALEKEKICSGLERAGYVLLETQALLTAEIRAGSAVGHQVQSLMMERKIVPQSLLLDMFREAIRAVPGPVLLSDFPRSALQLKRLQEHCRVAHVLQLQNSLSDGTAADMVGTLPETSVSVVESLAEAQAALRRAGLECAPRPSPSQPMLEEAVVEEAFKELHERSARMADSMRGKGTATSPSARAKGGSSGVGSPRLRRIRPASATAAPYRGAVPAPLIEAEAHADALLQRIVEYKDPPQRRSGGAAAGKGQSSLPAAARSPAAKRPASAPPLPSSPAPSRSSPAPRSPAPGRSSPAPGSLRAQLVHTPLYASVSPEQRHAVLSRMGKGPARELGKELGTSPVASPSSTLRGDATASASASATATATATATASASTSANATASASASTSATAGHRPHTPQAHARSADRTRGLPPSVALSVAAAAARRGGRRRKARSLPQWDGSNPQAQTHALWEELPTSREWERQARLLSFARRAEGPVIINAALEARLKAARLPARTPHPPRSSLAGGRAAHRQGPTSPSQHSVGFSPPPAKNAPPRVLNGRLEALEGRLSAIEGAGSTREIGPWSSEGGGPSPPSGSPRVLDSLSEGEGAEGGAVAARRAQLPVGSEATPRVLDLNVVPESSGPES